MIDPGAARAVGAASTAAAPGPDPELLAIAVQACPLVAGLHGGEFGEVATYLPGRRVQGVRVTAAGADIHVVGRYPATMAQVAAQVRDAVAGLCGELPIDVTIEDVALPGEVATGDPASGGAIRYDPAMSGPGPRAGAPAFPPELAAARQRAPVAPHPPATAFAPKEPVL